MSRQMFIYRMVSGRSGDSPFDKTPVHVGSARLHREISDTSQVDIDYTGDVDYVLNELSHSRLRQGWGVANPDLDLRLEEHTWIENYIIAGHKYWSMDTDISHAWDRRKILGCMLDMHEGDVIFAPKKPQVNRTCRTLPWRGSLRSGHGGVRLMAHAGAMAVRLLRELN